MMCRLFGAKNSPKQVLYIVGIVRIPFTQEGIEQDEAKHGTDEG